MKKAKASLPMLPFKEKVPREPTVHDCNFKPGDYFLLGWLNPGSIRIDTIRMVKDAMPGSLEEDMGSPDVARYKMRMSADPLTKGGPRVDLGWGDEHGYKMLFVDDAAEFGMLCITYWVPGTVQFLNPLWPDSKTRHLGYDIRHCMKVRSSS